MKKRVIAGVLVATTLAMGSLVSINLNSSNVSKASKITASKDAKTNEQQISDVDLAMVENQAEEKYIASLVSTKTNKKYTVENWEECLAYLESNYEALKADESVDMNKVDSYINGYQFVKAENSGEATATAEEETGANAAIVNGTFDVNKTLEYIAEYNDEYNPAYPSYNGWGGDCANFVSQCLYEGGMQMVGSNASNFSNWFCRTSVTEEFSKVSSTWRGAEAFCSYWSKNAMEYQDFDISYFEDKLTFNPVYRYAQPGYAMTFFNSNGRPYHTTIVNLKNRDGDREIRFAAHSSFQWEKSLFDYIHGGTMSKVRIYKTYTPDPELEATYDYDMENIEVEVVDSLNPPVEEKRGFWESIFRR